jgi:lipopolysaccharide export system protein LptA
VFVAYNLFSLQANTVLYEMESRRLVARGNVVVEDESGKHSAVSMTFKIEDGRAVPIE